jgi:hypothetical protein
MNGLRLLELWRELELRLYRFGLRFSTSVALVTGSAELVLLAFFINAPLPDTKTNRGLPMISLFFLVLWIVFELGYFHWNQRRHFVSTRTAFQGATLSCGFLVLSIALQLFTLIDQPSADVYYKWNWCMFGLCSFIVSFRAFSTLRHSRNPVTETLNRPLLPCPLSSTTSSAA